MKSICTYDMRATKLARRLCSGGCHSHMRLPSVIQQASTAWVLGEQEAMQCSTSALLGARSVDQRGGNGGTAAERGFEQSGLCKHAVSVEAITCHTCRFPQKVAGVGDMDDTGQSSAVFTLMQDMQTVYVAARGRHSRWRRSWTCHVSSGDATVQAPQQGMR
jgi:hypothetical protein